MRKPRGQCVSLRDAEQTQCQHRLLAVPASACREVLLTIEATSLPGCGRDGRDGMSTQQPWLRPSSRIPTPCFWGSGSPVELQRDQPAYRESGLSTAHEEARYQAASSWVPGALVEPFQEKLTQNKSELVPDSRGYAGEGSPPSLRLARRVGQRTEVGWVVQSLQG